MQLRALVGRFGSQNAMVGRLDDLGAGVADKKKKKMTSTSAWKSNLERELVTGVG